MPTQQTQPTARILRKAITQTYSAGMEQSPQLIQRYEMKYRISSDLVPAVRDAIRPFCIPDKAGVDGVYTISSLYLDGPVDVCIEKRNNESRIDSNSGYADTIPAPSFLK